MRDDNSADPLYRGPRGRALSAGRRAPRASCAHRRPTAWQTFRVRAGLPPPDSGRTAASHAGRLDTEYTSQNCIELRPYRVTHTLPVGKDFLKWSEIIGAVSSMKDRKNHHVKLIGPCREDLLVRFSDVMSRIAKGPAAKCLHAYKRQRDGTEEEAVVDALACAVAVHERSRSTNS